MKRRVIAMAAGMLAAMLPLMALAQEHEGGSDFEAANRALPAATDWGLIMLITVLAVLGLFMVAAIGYAYRRARGLEWRFQRPDAPADHH